MTQSQHLSPLIFTGERWAAFIEKITSIALLGVIFLGVSLLWWPSVPAWRFMCTAIPAIFLCWLTGRLISARTDIVGNFFHLAIVIILLAATYHGLKDGLTKASNWPYTLQGQFSGSLGLQFFVFSMLIMLCDDLLKRKPLIVSAVTTLAAFIAAAFALSRGVNESGRVMLVFTGVCGFFNLLKLLAPLFVGKIASPAGKDVPNSQKRFAKLILGLSLIVSLVIIAASLSISGFGDKSKITMLGFGDLSLAKAGENAGTFETLSLSLGVLAAAVIPLCVLTKLSTSAFKISKDTRPAAGILAGLDSMALAAALAAWLAPTGLFSPAVNILLAVHLSGSSELLARRQRRISGFFLLGATCWLCALLGMISNMGLMVWVLGRFDNRDAALHAFFGLLITQMLLWLLAGRKFGVIIALAVSLGISGGGEVAQKLWSQRSYEFGDFKNHAAGTAAALGIFILCRLAANGYSYKKKQKK